MTHVVLATPTLSSPHPAYIAAAKASVPLIESAGFKCSLVFEIGNVYISHARSVLLHKALAAGADIVVFIDHDLSWNPEALLKVIQTSGDVVAGTYRFKSDPEEYMSTIHVDAAGRPVGRLSDGSIRAQSVPAGFLKVTRAGVERFARAYPELLFGSPVAPYLDLFNHGAHRWTWWGEDYAFSRRWCECGGDIWLVPDIDIDHHLGDQVFRGNFHRFLLPRHQLKAA